MAKMDKGLDSNGLLYLLHIVRAEIDGKVAKVDGKGLSTNDLTDELKSKIESAGSGGLSDSDVETLINAHGFQTAQQVASAIASEVANAVRYCGTVSDMDTLNAISAPKKGDMYNVETDGMNYVWNGSAWDAQAPTITIEALTNEEIQTIWDGE